MNPKKILLSGAVILFVGMISSALAQSIIGFNVESPKYAYTAMTTGDYAGAPGVHTNNWNNLKASSDGSDGSISLAAGTVNDSSGNVVNGMAVTLQPALSGSSGVFNRGSGSFTNDSKMFIDVSDTWGCSGFSQFGYIDITNIPYTNYEIYCYFRPDNGSGSGNTRGGFFLITNTPTGSQRCYLQNQTNSGVNEYGQLPDPTSTGSGPASTGVNYIQSTTTSIPSGGAPWSSIQGGNYCVFTGLTNSYTRVWFGGLGNSTGAGGSGNAGQDDLGNWVTGGSTAVRFKVAGIQIYQVPGATPTNLYLVNTNLTLHAGDPSGTQLLVKSDLNDGTVGVSETANCTYSVDNTSVVTVTTGGLLKAGTNGTANLIVTLPSTGLSLTNPVSVVGPVSLSISVGDTNLLAGNGQGDTTTGTLLATFLDATNVDVNGFNFVSFGGSPTGVILVSTNGTITALAAGTFSVTGTYDGLSVTTNNVGQVTAWSNPVSVPAIGVHFTGGNEGMLFHDLAGYTGVRAGYWNNFVQNPGSVTNQLNNPTDDQGNVLGTTVIQFIPDFGGTLANQGIDTVGTITTNESVFFGNLLDLGMNNGTTVASELVVSNVPYASYDVYFYIWNDTSATNRPADFTIDGVTQYRINNASYPSQPANDGTGYVIAAPQPGSLPASIVDVPFGNVVKFSGVTDSTLTAQIAAVGQDYIGDANAVTRVRLAGFQIVESLDGLTATNIYLSPPVVPAQLPGNPLTYGLSLLADFNNGTKDGNITSLPGVTYNSSNPNVFEVDTNGNITPGLTPGTATLTITYQTNTLTTTVTNLAPLSATVVANPSTVYLNSILGVQPAQAEVLATFAGQTNVNISGFSGVTYVDQGSAAATLSGSGAITANAVGQASLGASYLGTTYVGTNAFDVLDTGGAPVLAHQYNFRDASNSTVIIDSVGGANGTIYPPLSTNLPITLDGQRAIFPGDGDYTVEPYIALPQYLISSMGDVSIEIWCGQSHLNTWARFFGFGNTPKGTNPHVLGGTATTSLQLMASYGGTGLADDASPGGGDFYSPLALTNGAEYQMVVVCAPNAGVAQFYINGVLVTNGTPPAAYLSTSVNDLDDWLGVSLSNNDSPLAGWINNLAIYEGVMPADQVASDYAAGRSIYSPPATVSTTPVPVTFSLSSGNLNLAWPADHLGWTLQVQTNALDTGLGTNWVAVPGSTTVTNMTIQVSPANGSVFYRLVYP